MHFKSSMLLCHCNLWSQNPPTSGACYLRATSAETMQAVTSPKRFHKHKSVKSLPSSASWRLPVSVGVLHVMTVQGLSYLEKWSCLHQSQHPEDVAPSRQIVFICPHAPSHLPNRTGAGCRERCRGGFHLHPG